MGWCLVRTKPRSENLASHWLGKLGLEVFLPQYQKTRSHARKVETISVPLFSRYLFVRGAVRKTEIESTIGCSGLFTYADLRPQETPDCVIEEIRARVDPKTGLIPVTIEGKPAETKFFEKGNTLRITAGPYTDLRGLYVEPVMVAGMPHSKISLKFMGGEIEHLVPDACVEKVAA